MPRESPSVDMGWLERLVHDFSDGMKVSAEEGKDSDIPSDLCRLVKEAPVVGIGGKLDKYI